MTLLHSEINELKLDSLHQFTKNFKATERMPALFVGHGNPMNAIEDNLFTQGFKSIAKELPKPNAILCISAHWETKGTFVTAMKQPETIHDFGGFPSRLYEVQYPAPGSPELALSIQQTLAYSHCHTIQYLSHFHVYENELFHRVLYLFLIQWI